MSDIEIFDGSRFSGELTYKFSSQYRPSDKEDALKNCIDSINDICDEGLTRAKLETSDPNLLKSMSKLVEDVIQPLRNDGEACSSAEVGANRDQVVQTAFENIFYYKGVLVDRREFIFQRPFTVLPIPRDLAGNAIRPIEDIEIRTRDVSIPDALQSFKVELDNTCRVIKVACSQPLSTGFQFLKWFVDNPGQSATETASAKLDRYLYPLLEISKIGLMNQHPTQSTFASLALKGLQREFVDREAGRVKNSYIVRLGRWSACIFVLCALLFFVFGTFDVGNTFFRYRRFSLLAAGAALGTWLSFSLRRVTLEFGDLAVLEDDRLNPGVRVAFVVLMTLVVGLLFWTQAITVKLGEFSSDFRVNGAFALLIGALCGIAERGLATAVTKRAGDFVSGIGGK